VTFPRTPLYYEVLDAREDAYREGAAHTALCTARTDAIAFGQLKKRLRASFTATTTGQAGAIGSFRDAPDGDLVRCRWQMQTGRYY
jgi:hypothetical protein